MNGEEKKSGDGQVHPFLLEWVVEEKRRKSYAVADREMILSYAATVAVQEEAKSTFDIDETYMMFGGKDYIKVWVCINDIDLFINNLGESTEGVVQTRRKFWDYRSNFEIFEYRRAWITHSEPNLDK